TGHYRFQARGDIGSLVFVGDFLPDEIGHIKAIDDLLAKRGDARRLDVERQIRENRGDFRQEAGAVEAFDLDDGELVRQAVGDRHRWRDDEGLVLAAVLGAGGDDFRQAFAAGKHVLDHLADGAGASQLVRIVGEFTADVDGVERTTIRRRENLRIG